MKKLLLLILLFTVLSVYPESLNKAFRLIPQPQSVVVVDGSGFSFNELKYIRLEGQMSLPVLGNLVGRLPLSPKEGKSLCLKITDKDVPESAEGYVLVVDGDGVTISARGTAGIFYGCQTLEQLMEDSRDFNLIIPRMKITDYPSINYRAVHFDTKHHLDRMDYYYREIDKLASYKVNAVIWELEDKLRYMSHPEIGASNAIGKQEMEALCRYAKDRNIDISPLVQGLGHAGYILKHHKDLRENPESDWEFCPSDSGTYKLQLDLYREAIEAMPYGKYLHVGGDEISSIGVDSRCKATGKTPFELQMLWLQKVCSFAFEHGRIPIFWDDMPLKYGDVWDFVNSEESKEVVEAKWNTDKLDKAIDLFPKGCVYMRWNYRDPNGAGHKKILAWYHNKGLNVMAATAAAAGDSPVMPREGSRTKYIRDFCLLTEENRLNGILATCWDDGSPHSETVWRGYIALGSFGWNPQGQSLEEFKAAHAQREFGFKAEENRLGFLDDLEKSLFFYEGALVTSGRRNPAWGVTSFTLMDLPDKNKRGAWSSKYKDRIAQAKLESVRYDSIANRILVAKQLVRRNRYTLDIYEQINKLQHFPTSLILALNDYDGSKTKSDKMKAMNKIKDICEGFSVMRKELEEVYSKTRFMNAPDGFIDDQNKANHLAAKSDNSDWMYLYELPMIIKVNEWMNSK